MGPEASSSADKERKWTQCPEPEENCIVIKSIIGGDCKSSQEDKLAQNRNNTQLLSSN